MQSFGVSWWYAMAVLAVLALLAFLEEVASRSSSGVEKEVLAVAVVLPGAWVELCQEPILHKDICQWPNCPGGWRRWASGAFKCCNSCDLETWENGETGLSVTSAFIRGIKCLMSWREFSSPLESLRGRESFLVSFNNAVQGKQQGATFTPLWHECQGQQGLPG